MDIALVAFLGLFACILAGIPIAFAMAGVGFAGVAYVLDGSKALAMLGQITFETGMSYGLSVVPLFILMGNFVTRAGLSEELYDASNAWLGHQRGGLAMATIVACTGFSAICGSSLATAATMSRVSMPSMRRYGYDARLAAGSIAAGGTLGILIPPSVILILYGIMANQDIGILFAAGIVPGLLGMLGYLITVKGITTLYPEQGPRGERRAFGDRVRSLRGVWGVLALFLLVMGGIYLGVFTPTEAAGIGSTGAFLFALGRRSLSWRSLLEVLVDSAKTTAMIFTVLIGALMFSNLMNLLGLPTALLDWMQSFHVPPWGTIAILLATYVVLGCVLESLSMVLLTVPIFYPMVEALGFDLVWFGILVVIITEISLITPPVGLNVFVLKATLPEDVSTGTIFRGVAPFWMMDLVRLAIVMLVPGVTLLLPRLMGYVPQ